MEGYPESPYTFSLHSWRRLQNKFGLPELIEAV